MAMRKKTASKNGLEAAMDAPSDGGRRRIERSHGLLSERLAPIGVCLDVLRLQLHAATATSDSHEASEMAGAAALCDEARSHLDSMRRLVHEAHGAAGLDRAA